MSEKNRSFLSKSILGRLDATPTNPQERKARPHNQEANDMNATATADREDDDPKGREYTLSFPNVNMHIRHMGDNIVEMTLQDWSKGVSVAIMTNIADRETIISAMDGLDVPQ